MYIFNHVEITRTIFLWNGNKYLCLITLLSFMFPDHLLPDLLIQQWLYLHQAPHHIH